MKVLERLGLPPAKEMRKAYVAAAGAAVGSMITALSDGTLTPAEITLAILTGLGAGIATFAVTNGGGGIQ